MSAYIFGYGSLLNPNDWVIEKSTGDSVYGFLSDHQRHFEIVINNQDPNLDQKHYLEQGTRPDYIIGSLAISPSLGFQTNGLAIPVSSDLLKLINLRERNYFLSNDISHLFSCKLPGPLFTYYPKNKNHDLYLIGKKEGRIFLPRSYLDYCLEGFSVHDGESDFLSLTKILDYPLKDLDFYRSPGTV